MTPPRHPPHPSLPQLPHPPPRRPPSPAAPAPAPEPAAPAPAPAAAAPAPAPAAAAPAAAAVASDGPTYVTPLVRKLAQAHGVDLASVKGTGVGGRIRKQDVLAAAEAAKAAAEAAKAEAAAPAPAPAAAAPSAPAAAASTKLPVSELRGTTVKMPRLRKVIASRMVESMQTMAQLTTVVEVDVTKVAALRTRVKDEFQARTGQKLTYLPFFAKAAVEALQAYPTINARIEGDQIVYPDSENLSIAVDTPRGLVVPVVKNAQDLSIAGIAAAINDLASRTRENKISPDDLSGGTFTLTNTGSAGALFDTPIVPLPTVAILGVGTIVKRAVVVPTPEGETIGIRSMVYLALSYDHRIVDGADAGRYLTAVRKRLEEGAFEADLGM